MPTYFWGASGVELSKADRGRPLARETTAAIAELGNVRFINFAYRNVSDFDLQNLRRVSGVRTLKFEENSISDAGLEYIAEIRSIEQLFLGDSKIRGPGLAHFTDHPSLSEIVVPFDVNYDLTIRLLRRVPNLQSITIGYPPMIEGLPATIDKPSGIQIRRGDSKKDFFDSYSDSALDMRAKNMEWAEAQLAELAAQTGKQE